MPFFYIIMLAVYRIKVNRKLWADGKAWKRSASEGENFYELFLD